jgi:hypothetical protein
VELSGHPLWTIIVLVGALIAIGLQLRMLRRMGARVTWGAMIPLVIAAAAGGAIADRLEGFAPLAHFMAQNDHQRTVSDH